MPRNEGLEGYESLQDAGFCPDLTRRFLRFLVNFENFLVENVIDQLPCALDLARFGIGVTLPNNRKATCRDKSVFNECNGDFASFQIQLIASSRQSCIHLGSSKPQGQ
jgi:hypothetical protein